MDIIDNCSQVDVFDIELDTHFTYNLYEKDTVTFEDGSVYMEEHQTICTVDYWEAPVGGGAV